MSKIRLTEIGGGDGKKKDNTDKDVRCASNFQWQLIYKHSRN